jgi:O-antigen/teichoic acid export membrane protein
VFGIDRVVQNTVGTDVYGTYFPLLNLVLIFQIFLDLGIDNFTRKEVAHNPGLTNRFLSQFLLLKFILMGIFILIFSTIGYFIPHSKQEWNLLVVLVINQSLASLILYLRANMGGLHLFKAESIISVLDRFIMIIVCGALLLLPFTRLRFEIIWFALAQTLAYLVAVAFSLIIILRKTSKLKLKIDLVGLIPIIRQLKPYATLVLLMAFYYRVDSIFLRYLLPDGKVQAGIYAHGFRIIDFMGNYALIFSFILLPMFSTMIRKKENISPLLRLSSISLMVPSFAILAGVLVYRYDIFYLLYPKSTAISANVFQYLVISFIGLCFSYTFGALLTAKGYLRELNRMALVAVVISSVLNIILIPRYQVIGAAIANASSQVFAIFFHIIVATKRFKLRVDVALIIKVVLFIAATLGFAFILSNHVTNWIAGLLIISGFSLIFAASIKLLKLSFLINLIKSYSNNQDLSTS